MEGLKRIFDYGSKPLAAVLALALGTGFFFLMTNSIINKAEKIASTNNKELVRFNSLKEEYLIVSASQEPLIKKLLASQTEKSVGEIIEEIGDAIGIKDRISSFKPTEDKVEKGYMQKGVEVKIDGISFNELLNLLYKIENHRNLLLIKDFSMKAHFDDPGVSDVIIQVVLVAMR